VLFLGQLGKYLHGSVWPVMAQMELDRDYQVPERASGAAVGVFLLVVVGTGLAVAAAAAPLLGRTPPTPTGGCWPCCR
jgi:glycosyltransferase 2 family protein